MIATHKSPETFFAILRTVKSIQENYHKINQEIRAEFGPEPDECMDFHASWLSQYQTNLLSQLLYWKEELYEQLNNN